MKRKFKPVAKADIRERVESKMRARGAVRFHQLLMVCAGILLLYNLPALWPPNSTGDTDTLLVYTALCGILCTSGALHYIRYSFRHGRGREWHETETEARIKRRLRHADAEDAEEQEELVRLRVNDQLKNRRLAWQHIALYIGITLMFFVGHAVNMPDVALFEWGTWSGVFLLFSIWGIGLAAQVLRYYFAYAYSTDRFEASIEAQVSRELRRIETLPVVSASPLDNSSADQVTIQHIEEARKHEELRAKER